MPKAINKLIFTKAALQKLSVSDGKKREYFYDLRTPGLGVMVFPSGTKTFFHYRRVEGRPEKYTIGKFPQYSVENAQREATRLNGEIAQGKNPSSDRRGIRQDITFGDAFKSYLERHARIRKRSWKQDQENYNRYLSHLGKRKLQSIDRATIRKLHNDIAAENGPYAANRALALVSVIFNKAIDWEWKGENPALRIEKFKETQRDRFLQPNEAQAFFKALEEETHEAFRDYIYLSLFTGARRANVMAMRWDEISFDHMIWAIRETKNGSPLHLPLAPQAIEVLQNRKMALTEETGNLSSEWVFPAASQSGHMEEPKKRWKALLKRAGIDDFRLHDLRRTLGSYQAISGASTTIIGKSLGHKSLAATAIYARLHDTAVRASVETAINKMTSAK